MENYLHCQFAAPIKSTLIKDRVSDFLGVAIEMLED